MEDYMIQLLGIFGIGFVVGIIVGKEVYENVVSQKWADLYYNNDGGQPDKKLVSKLPLLSRPTGEPYERGWPFKTTL